MNSGRSGLLGILDLKNQLFGSSVCNYIVAVASFRDLNLNNISRRDFLLIIFRLMYTNLVVLRPVLTSHKKVAEPSANRVTRNPTMSTHSSDRWTFSPQQHSSKTRKFHWRTPSLSSTIPTSKRPEIRPAVCVAFGAPIRYRNPSTPKCPKSTNPRR